MVNPYGRLFCGGAATSGRKVVDTVNAFLSLKPMILCRTNKQVKAIQQMGYPYAETIHQAKGLEYPNVVVVDSTITNGEDLNIAYVAMTRAENNLLVIN